MVNPQRDVLGLDQAARLLPAGTTLLAYYLAGEDLLVWAVTRDDTSAMHRRIDIDVLDHQVSAFHTACRLGRPNWRAAGMPLAAILLDPVADLIEPSAALVIVPFGSMHRLPFQALPYHADVLGAHVAVCVLPSASTLPFLAGGDRDLDLSSVLAVGNPSRMAWAPPGASTARADRPLPAAATEAHLVRRAFPDGDVLTRAVATEPRVVSLLGRHPVVHFATHAHLSDEAPNLSAILLADGEALNVYELLGSDLRADLVVLSACNTGLGEVTPGEEVVRLTRALLGAGARAALSAYGPSATCRPAY